MQTQLSNVAGQVAHCVEFRHVSVVQNNYCILDNISLRITERRVGIIGNNGSGKSTFARCACGLLPVRSSHSSQDNNLSINHNNNQSSAKVTYTQNAPDTTTAGRRPKNIMEKGEILLHGKSLASYKTHVWKHINMTFQIPDQQIIMPSVAEELALGLKYCNFSKTQVQEKIDYALDILKVPRTQACHSLSAGQKRLLCLLSILLIEPKTIILDEPTTFLDMAAKMQIMDFILALPQQLILITHDLFLLEHFLQVVCFEKGKIFANGLYEDTVKEYKTLW